MSLCNILDFLGERRYVLLGARSELLVDGGVVLDWLATPDLSGLDTGGFLLLGLRWIDGLVNKALSGRRDIGADDIIEQRCDCESLEVLDKQRI